MSGTANNNPSNRGHSFSGPPDFLIVYNPQLIGRTNHVNINMLHSFEHQSIVCCVKFSKDGQYFATGSNRQAQIFDVASAQRLRCFLEPTKKLNEDSYVRTVAFSPNGQYLVSGSEDKSVKVWDIAASNLKSVLTGHELDIYAVEVSSDNRFVVSGSGDGKTKIWDLQKLSLIHTLDAPVTSDSTNATGKLSGTEGVTSIAITPDNALIATGCLDNVIRLWDSETGQLVHTLQGHQDSVYALSFSPDGRNLVSGSLDKNLKIWNVVNTQCVSTLTGHRDYVLSVVYSVDGNWVISGSKDRSVQFWDVRNDQLHLMLQGHRNSVISIGMSPAQPVFGTGSGDCRARIWKYDVTNLVATQ